MHVNVCVCVCGEGVKTVFYKSIFRVLKTQWEELKQTHVYLHVASIYNREFDAAVFCRVPTWSVLGWIPVVENTCGSEANKSEPGSAEWNTVPNQNTGELQ